LFTVPCREQAGLNDKLAGLELSSDGIIAGHNGGRVYINNPISGLQGRSAEQ